jgi:hypothetical protein
MATDVKERRDLTVVAANEDDALAGDRDSEIGARLCNVGTSTRQNPPTRPDESLLRLENLRVGVPRALKRGDQLATISAERGVHSAS